MRIPRKPGPSPWRPGPAHSAYAASMGAPDPGRYRRTPPSAPDVAALVRPGLRVRTSYDTGGIVVAVEGPHLFTSHSGETLPHHTIVYVPEEKYGCHQQHDLHWIGECVAVHGRILMLFDANDDEVFIETDSGRWPADTDGPRSRDRRRALARFRLISTRAAVTRKTVEIDVADAAASMLMDNVGTASFELWAKQQAMAAEGAWVDAGPIATTLFPEITVEVQRIDACGRN